MLRFCTVKKNNKYNLLIIALDRWMSLNEFCSSSLQQKVYDPLKQFVQILIEIVVNIDFFVHGLDLAFCIKYEQYTLVLLLNNVLFAFQIDQPCQTTWFRYQADTNPHYLVQGGNWSDTPKPLLLVYSIRLDLTPCHSKRI